LTDIIDWVNKVRESYHAVTAKANKRLLLADKLLQQRECVINDITMDRSFTYRRYARLFVICIKHTTISDEMNEKEI
jgi:hypothetical protein